MSGLPRQERQRLKIILVGSSGVGKTCLIASFFKKPFDPSGLSTVSPAYMFQDVVRKDGLTVCLQIWDTAGQERYQSVSQLFFRDANVAFVCFEAGNDDSMDTVSDWTEKVLQEVPDCQFLFVATKADLLPSDETEKVRQKAENMFSELSSKGCYVTSAMTRDGVDALFMRAAELFVPAQQAKRQVKEVQNITANEPPAGFCC
jgi:small GTP-binding protein